MPKSLIMQENEFPVFVEDSKNLEESRLNLLRKRSSWESQLESDPIFRKFSVYYYHKLETVFIAVFKIKQQNYKQLRFLTPSLHTELNFTSAVGSIR